MGAEEDNDECLEKRLTIDEAFKEMFLNVLKNWVNSPEADEPFILATDGESYTPRRIYELIVSNAEEGNEFIEAYMYGVIDYSLYSLRKAHLKK